ncbi:hypothetical protein I79_015534 [Cricetulus griseus]|uniref:Uncharacterized protein n=1 Tax=Cricetulus griseus TaxID=10029 RepID=G3HX19_CRIGR|nr:hypothetical protein I79_015534 [Cricetulus griseus]
MDSGLIFALWFCWVSTLRNGSKKPQTCAARLLTSFLLLFLLGQTSLVECRQGPDIDFAQPS